MSLRLGCEQMQDVCIFGHDMQLQLGWISTWCHHVVSPSQCQAFTSMHPEHMPLGLAAVPVLCRYQLVLANGQVVEATIPHLHTYMGGALQALRGGCWHHKFMCCGAGSSSVVCDVCSSPCGLATAGSIARQHPVTLCAVCWLWACNVQSC